MRVFDVRDQIEEILANEVDHETGEIQESALDKLDALGLEMNALVLDLAAYSVGEIAEAKAISEQAKKLMERAARHSKRADWLEEVISRNLPVGQKLSDARVTIGWRKSTAVRITDESAIPDEFYRYSRAIDKAEISKSLKAEQKVPGAELEHRSHLVVK